ncbi:hypothetical protein FOL47_003274 [Perkinsus chesapeaki]|uniref:AMP-dependent synthetase/ligase domain-containing protein n=1 Tax=Perkinsus chesapeaki TaxID=330153 RepID=A0A7J6N2S4_PERCH|nr:hypothetical protein FOL47_003274 [Perkinsus chesapeaki]
MVAYKYPYNLYHHAFEDPLLASLTACATLETDGTVTGVLTYAEICSKGKDMAYWLSEVLGVKEGDCVGVAIERSATWVSVLLACSALGTVMAPLDPSANEGRLRHLINQTKPDILIARPGVGNTGSLASMAPCRVVDAPEDVPARPTGWEAPELSTCDPGYRPLFKMFSGGTTGTPKMIIVTHGMPLSELRGYAQEVVKLPPGGPQPVVLQFAGLQWLASMMGQVNIALSIGGVCLFADNLKAGLQCTAYPPTVVGAVPTQLFLNATLLSKCKLTHLLLWGEASTPAKLAELQALVGSARVIDLLTATEFWLCLLCDDGSGMFRTLRSKEVAIKLAPLGDQETDPSRSGRRRGELMMRGPFVCQLLTDAEGWFRTGDVAEMDDAGRIHYLGRLGGRLKASGGVWIDALPIEQLALSCGAAVEEASVLSHNGRNYMFVYMKKPEAEESDSDSDDWYADSSDSSGSEDGELQAPSYAITEEDEMALSMLGQYNTLRSALAANKDAAVLDLTIRMSYKPLPRNANTNKIDRFQLVKEMLGHENCWRLSSEPERWRRLMSAWKRVGLWGAGSFLACGPREFLLHLPYMWLSTLHMTAFNDDAKTLRERAGLFFLRLIRNSPFDRLGFFIGWFALSRRFKPVQRLTWAWTLIGAWLAFKDGRLLSWAPAFWYAIGNQGSYESAKWFSWGFAKRQMKYNAQWFWWYFSFKWLRTAQDASDWENAGSWNAASAVKDDKVDAPRDDESIDGGLGRHDAASVLTDEAPEGGVEEATELSKIRLLSEHENASPVRESEGGNSDDGNGVSTTGSPTLTIEGSGVAAATPGPSDHESVDDDIMSASDADEIPETLTPIETTEEESVPNEKLEVPPQVYRYRTFLKWWWEERALDRFDWTRTHFVKGVRNVVRTVPDATQLVGDVNLEDVCALVSGITGWSNVKAETDLGGMTSLQVSMLMKKLPVQVAAKDVLICKDVARLVELLQSPRKEQEALRPIGPNEPFRAWFAPGQLTRVCKWAFQIRGDLDMDRLQAAVDRMVDRHPMLRAHIVGPARIASFLYDSVMVLLPTLSRLPEDSWTAWWLRVLICKPLWHAWVKVVCTERDDHVPIGVRWSWGKDPRKCQRQMFRARNDMEDDRTDDTPLKLYLVQQRIDDPNDPEKYIVRRQFLFIMIRHAWSDALSYFPIADDLSKAFTDEDLTAEPLEVVDPRPLLQQRFYDGLRVTHGAPDRSSFRGSYFYDEFMTRDAYHHYCKITNRFICHFRYLAEEHYHIPLEHMIIAWITLSLARADQNENVGMTLYTPLRDGPMESQMLALLADWRDFDFDFSLERGSVMDAVLHVSDKLRRRDYTVFDQPGNPEATLLNFLSLDTRVRGNGRLRHVHVDKVGFRDDDNDRSWGWVQRQQWREGPGHRKRSMSLEQNSARGAWSFAVTLAPEFYPANWCRRFSHYMKLTADQMFRDPMASCGRVDDDEEGYADEWGKWEKHCEAAERYNMFQEDELMWSKVVAKSEPEVEARDG